EARKSENLPPVEGGDSLFLQQQNFSLAALAKRDASDDPFGKGQQQMQPSPEPVDESGKALSETELFAAKSMLRGLLTK
ncbi:phage portal protein, partial [Salmonella enterica]